VRRVICTHCDQPASDGRLRRGLCNRCHLRAKRPGGLPAKEFLVPGPVARFAFVLEPRLKEEIEAAAFLAGMPPTAWVRRACQMQLLALVKPG
jgi:hypothetical protein